MQSDQEIKKCLALLSLWHINTNIIMLILTFYTTLVNQHTYGLKDLDEQTRNLALYYLIRSYELGYKDAIYTIRDDLGEKTPIQKSSYYLNKMAEYDFKK